MPTRRTTITASPRPSRSPATRTPRTRAGPGRPTSGVVVEHHRVGDAGATGRSARSRARSPPAPAPSWCPSPPCPRRAWPGRCRTRRPCRRTARRRAPRSAASSTARRPGGSSNVDARPSSVIVTLAPSASAASTGVRRTGGPGSTWNSSAWTASRLDALGEQQLAQRRRPSRTARRGTTRRRSSGGSSAVEDPAQPLGVEPAGEQLDLLRLPGEHVQQLEPVGVAVLEVLELLEEHHRCRAVRLA